jgi:hypothetical protein
MVVMGCLVFAPFGSFGFGDEILETLHEVVLGIFLLLELKRAALLEIH